MAGDQTGQWIAWIALGFFAAFITLATTPLWPDAIRSVRARWRDMRDALGRPAMSDPLDLQAQVEFYRSHYEAALLNWNEMIRERDEALAVVRQQREAQNDVKLLLQVIAETLPRSSDERRMLAAALVILEDVGALTRDEKG